MFAALAAAFVTGIWLMVRPDGDSCSIKG
jgi:hypothetical protein